jgi:hypothetical protein
MSKKYYVVNELTGAYCTTCKRVTTHKVTVERYDSTYSNSTCLYCGSVTMVSR